MNIIVRYATYDVDAQVTAQGMENAGASVFSITNDPTGWQIWAKCPAEVDAVFIDAMIREERDSIGQRGSE